MSKYFYHIITLGCQMNKNDSERMATILKGMNMEVTALIEQADVIMINTCSVRQAAEDRVSGLTRNFKKLKKQNPNLIIGITGCLPGRDAKGILRDRLHDVDLYFPTHEMIYLPQRLSELNPDLRPMEDLAKDYLALRPTIDKAVQSFVTIQTGCNQFCTYCVVPYARGRELNRPVADILAEIQDLVSQGCLEVTLLGQIVNHYIAPDPDAFSSENPYIKNDFAKLLWEMNQIEGLDRVHYTAPHPSYMDDEVIDALTLPKQLNFLHLPVQSGNTEILARMNRKHDREFFLAIIEKIRKKKPNIAIGTDIIVGFCGETEAQFEETFDLYKQCDFDISYNAQYSTRSGTIADDKFEDDVSKEEKKRRWWVMQDYMGERTEEKNQYYVGKVVSVLVDTCKDGRCGGNSREMKRVDFKGDKSLLGTVVSVKIYKAGAWMLWGEAV
ncbi:tRNA (N6-isopentenyl adenosine(37)-C2)-methylthiotransferase MiaB [Patescibacteria group bacterium]|nr:tRNA (N6-isopentenyl adenosine(37)-C2)-methylthiotransferase MiaB [Patescibacteria group bacterium]MBU1721219.1 tRNA (N6-isopentenyl adenosine(37)-C2)-methylthiotransferase MiaB [Patescibacteria group bacterium]MBU1901073.1 tRNA (N6-isopentenyl adenosine(37)-C2)-methylthiotransferase MiaB [Patescibacteria group bacterium]